MKINIAYAPDDNFTNLAIVSMVSVLENNKNNEVEFIILYSKLKESSINAFNFLKIYKNCKIRFVKVDEDLFKNFPLASWVTVQTWFRTALGDLCPDLDKILYLDCDTLVVGDLAELFSMDLSNNLIAGVTDIVGKESHIKRLEIEDDTYFNAGVLLFNTRLIREENTFAKIKKYAVGRKLQCADQDVINKIAENQKMLLHPKYNYLETWQSNYEHDYDEKYSKLYSQAKDNPIIIHFVGMKPFFYKNLHSYKLCWWKYALMTHSADEYRRIFELEKENFKKDIGQFNILNLIVYFVLSKIIFNKKYRKMFKVKFAALKATFSKDRYFILNEKIEELLK